MNILSLPARYITGKPQQVEKKNHRKYIVILLTSIFGLLVHTAFIYLFCIINLKPMALINCISILIWALALRENYLGRHANAIYLSCLEIIAHAVLAVSYLGLDFGFQFYLWPLAALAVINPDTSKVKAIISSLVCISIFVLLELFFKNKASSLLSAEMTNYLLIMNTLAAAIPLILCVFSVQVINEQQEIRLTKLANVDELTQLYNRRYFNNFLTDYLKFASRGNRKFCMAIGDIDFFKQINDQHGHNIGDQVLKKVSQYLSESTRQTDIVCRWGGEEFIILFADTEQKKVLPVLESIRKNLSDSMKINDITELKVTMSFGLIEHSFINFNHSNQRLKNTDFINQADELLYKAKNAGRNCIKTI